MSQPSRPAGVDQLLGGEARARAEVGEVALRGARPDADACRGLSHGSARGDEGREDVDLAGGRRPRERSPQVPVSQRRAAPGCA